MAKEEKLKCPNCGRLPAEDELYCYFCEAETGKINGIIDFSSKAKHKKKI